MLLKYKKIPFKYKNLREIYKDTPDLKGFKGVDHVQQLYIEIHECRSFEICFF